MYEIYLSNPHSAPILLGTVRATTSVNACYRMRCLLRDQYENAILHVIPLPHRA